MTRHLSGLTVAAVAAGVTVLFASPAHAADRDCPDFSSQAAAQSYFESRGPGDPDRLDRDNDGIACETEGGGSGGGGGNDSSDNDDNASNGNTAGGGATPRGGVEAGLGGMADPVSPALPAAGALLGTVLVGAGVVAARRRVTSE